MKIKRLLWLSLALFLTVPLCAQKRNEVLQTLRKINDYPASLGANIVGFKATEYTKFHLHANRRNRLIDVLPRLFKLRWGEQDYMAEAEHELQYTAPGTWAKKAKAIIGTLPRLNDIQRLANNYTNVSVYERTLVADRLLSPLHPQNMSYYWYHYGNATRMNGRMVTKLQFKPKNHNPQLVRGHAWVDLQTGAVRRIAFKGKYDIVDIEMTAQMGTDSLLALLPEEEHIVSRLSFFGNKMDADYLIRYDYNEVSARPDSIEPEKPREKNYDLTQQHLLELDPSAFKSDMKEFAPLRPIPLSEREKNIYKENQLVKVERDTSAVQTPKRRRRSRVFWGAVGDFMLDKHDLNLQQVGNLRISPLITPTMLQYSPSRGISIRSDLRYTKLFPDGQLFRMRAKLGYNCKPHQFFWSVPLSLEYAPRRRGLFSAEVGNGNHSNSSEIVDALKKDAQGVVVSDSLADVIDRLELGLYRDLYAQASNRIDLWNGLTLTLGFIYHNRSLVHKRNVASAEGIVTSPIRQNYKSFAPRLRLTWTPCLYYYYKGKRKETLYSNYPTVFADYERGIKMGNCRMEYSRWEFGAEYRLKMWELRSLWFRAGGGFYDKTKNTYFVDYANFKYRSLPEGWDDDLSGQFQLLSSRYYNTSNYYAHACVTYESPMMMLTRIKYLTNYIQKERIYLNTLMVDQLHPYIEIGYGVGTMVCNAGAYVSFANGHYESVGFKFSLEFFNN